MTPVFFFSHGSPMNAIENNIFTQDWQALYRGTITPSAIVVFSAHWHVPGIRITTAKKLKTLHDFGGCPEALMQQQYPAATAIDTANKISAILKDQGHTIIHDENWGLDHGSWAVLKQLHPNADIPVIQISLDRSQSSLQWHYELAAALKPLRNEGVLFIGRGGIVH
ncbi:MAG: dioxygenase, partial [Pseudomonadales bacterium]|nr:dioxygenase [Pseudomonadales bacterium]